MLKLQRAVRIHDRVILPSGLTIDISQNVDARLSQWLISLARFSKAAEDRKRKKTLETEAAFWQANYDFLQTILGKDAMDSIASEFDADLPEICQAFSGWINAVVMPAMAEASKRRMEKRKK